MTKVMRETPHRPSVILSLSLASLSDDMKKVHRTTALWTFVAILATAAILALCYPGGQSHFKYKYAVNQPWRYQDVLIAPYDFEVRKSPEAVQQEQAYIEAHKDLYFSYNREVYRQQKDQLLEAYHDAKLPRVIMEHSSYVAYLLRELEHFYDLGMVDPAEVEQLTDSAKVFVIGKDNVARERQLSDLITTAAAYDSIIAKAPKGLDSLTLRQSDLTALLMPNVIYDTDQTSRMADARIASINEVVGVVFKGTKIVGLGEMVTPEIYQKLKGYELAYNEYARSTSDIVIVRLGLLALIAGTLLGLYFYLQIARPDLMSERRNRLFLLLQVLLFPAASYLLAPISPMVVYVIPYCMVLILTRVVMDGRTALVTFITAVLLTTLVVPDAALFLLLQVISGAVVLATLSDISQRRDLIYSAVWVPFVQITVYTAYTLAMEGTLTGFDINLVWYFAIGFIFLMFSYPLLYIVEKVFGYITPISLVELGDINKPLLKRESEVAPGTFQHVLNVSILSTAAISKIGGNVQLTRTGALYHDIGKMKNPIYFTENQGGENNPHFKLRPEESAKIIISHVTDGVEMARNAKLPEQIIDFIRTHHGLGMTKYFYIQYCNEHPGEVVDESMFRYPGPNPWTREQGVMMLADQVEASSRSLKEMNEEILTNHIDKIVDGIVSGGYLRNTPLTLKDIEMIKQVFLDKLRTMNHSRIKYPELNKEAKAAQAK